MAEPTTTPPAPDRAATATIAWIQSFLALMADPPPLPLPARLAAVCERFRAESPPWPPATWYPGLYAVLDRHHRAGCAVRAYQAPGPFVVTEDESLGLLQELRVLFATPEVEGG